MKNFYSILKYIKDRRERALSGKFNCIPLPFPRFRWFLPGTQMGKYIILTANQKIGKTKLADFVWVYETLFFIMQHPEVRLKVLLKM